MNKQIRDQSVEGDQSKSRLGLILAVVVVVGLLVFAWLYTRQVAEANPAPPVSEAATAQPETTQTEESAPVAQQNDVQSEDAAKRLVDQLSRFQDLTERNLSYQEYTEALAKLKADLNTTLPNFVRHNPSDETFRQEVNATLREYSAAGDWWKTCVENSAVVTDNDRLERLQAAWNRAKTHLDNAQSQLSR